MCILDLLPPPPSVGIAELSGCKDLHESLCNQVTAVALKSKPPLGGKGPFSPLKERNHFFPLGSHDTCGHTKKF